MKYSFCYPLSIMSLFISGGVLEKNEIFDNRFDGVSLATGVSPKMLGWFLWLEVLVMVCHDVASWEIGNMAKHIIMIKPFFRFSAE